MYGVEETSAVVQEYEVGLHDVAVEADIDVGLAVETAQYADEVLEDISV